MITKYVLYKYDPVENLVTYAKKIHFNSVERTTRPAEAQRFSAFFAMLFGLLFGFNWINEKHTTH